MSLIDDLKKVSRMNLDWDKMQNLDDDKGTEPYDIKSLSDFKNKWRFEQDHEKVKYALMRWFRYWCAKSDENLFVECGATPNPDKTDPLWDFELNGVKFDLKSTRLPNGVERPTTYKDIGELIVLYYRRASERKHNWQNRLFLVHLNEEDRINFAKKKEIISLYTKLGKPYTTTIDGHTVTADVLFVE